MKKYLIFHLLLVQLCWLGSHRAVAQDQVDYGFIQDANDPLLFTAVAYPNFSSNNITISTATFTFYLPTNTTTAPAVPVMPVIGTFTDITGIWRIERFTPGLYQSLGFNPADLQGNDIYQCILQNSPEPNLTNGQPLSLFSFRLPDNCLNGAVALHTNDNSIAQSFFSNLILNINNQMAISIDDAPSMDLYDENDPATSVYNCPLNLNEPPVANDDMATTAPDTPVNIPVLANDTDPNNNLDPNSVEIVNPAGNGTATVNPNGTVQYSPASGYIGADQFSYRVCDTGNPALCDTATVTLQVQPPGSGNYSISVPNYCACNALDGRADVSIKVTAIAGQNWTVKEVIGLYDSSSPPAPAALVPLTAGTPLNYIGAGMYQLDALRRTDKGYWIKVSNGSKDLDVMVGNASW
ncbi:MAG: cadherin-like domain-containing protein [Lewinellaceae bacterium]|nr:cadherin-like domain-containing protein [Lewinellaceae bacterium]